MSERFAPDPPAGERNSSNAFLTGLLLGGLVGVTVAMIVAPPAGDETVESVRGKVREASEGVAEAADDVAAAANDLLARGKLIVEDARARLDVAVAQGKEAAAHQRSILENET